MTGPRRRVYARGERGSALVLALLFLTVCGVMIGGVLKYSSASSTSTAALSVARGNDYDVIGAMNAAVATVRTGSTCGNGVYTTPSNTLNNSSRTLRVDCFPQSSSSVKRDDVLLVCPTTVSAPCPDNSALLAAEVTYYDSQGTGKTLQIDTWSNQ